MRGEYVFQSDRLAYRSIREEDTDILVSWRSNLSIIKYYRNQNSLTKKEHLEWYRERYLEDSRRLDLLARDGDVSVGFVALMHMDLEKSTAEVNYTIGNMDYRGRGLSVEMINAICDFGHEIFHISKFKAEIHKENHVSRRAAESAGFWLVGSEGAFLDYRKEI